VCDSPKRPAWSRSPLSSVGPFRRPASPGRSAKPAGHGEGDARFIEAREARGVERRDLVLIGRARLLDPVNLAFIGMERLLLRGSGRERTMRPMVGTRTCRPCCAARCAANAASVASGGSWTSRRTCAKAGASQMARRPPAWGRGRMSPVARRRRSNFSTKD
jgi:hypothetical protein